jgi:hypothetical protein
MNAIITRHRADGSIIGKPEVRKNVEATDFPTIEAELQAEVDNGRKATASFALSAQRVE